MTRQKKQTGTKGRRRKGWARRRWWWKRIRVYCKISWKFKSFAIIFMSKQFNM